MAGGSRIKARYTIEIFAREIGRKLNCPVFFYNRFGHIMEVVRDSSNTIQRKPDSKHIEGLLLHPRLKSATKTKWGVQVQVVMEQVIIVNEFHHMSDFPSDFLVAKLALVL